MSGEFILETRGLTKEFAGFVAVHDVNLRVRRGHIHALIGPNGAGKTTCFNLLSKFLKPSRGEVLYNGIDITALKPADVDRLGLVRSFQISAVFPHLTALENVQFGADVAGRAHADTIAASVLEQVGLGERAGHFAHQLSGGEQQRVAIARALATGNPILLADEPTGELDFRTGVQILELLRAQAEAGKTVIVVTHNREISRVADRVIDSKSRPRASQWPRRISLLRSHTSSVPLKFV